MGRGVKLDGDDLTVMQRAFVHEYMKDFNTSQAAIRAGSEPASAYVVGAKWARLPLIRSEIKRLMLEREKKCELDSQQLIKKLWEIVNLDFLDLYDEDDNGKLVPKPLEQLKPETVTALKGLGYGNHPLLYDKIEAIKLLGKHYGCFIEKDALPSDRPNPLIDMLKRSIDSAWK